jgi:hypothetical protein
MLPVVAMLAWPLEGFLDNLQLAPLAISVAHEQRMVHLLSAPPPTERYGGTQSVVEYLF